MSNPRYSHVAGTLILSAAVILSAGIAQAEPTYSLRSTRSPGTVDRVIARLEVGGDVTAGVEGQEDREKLSVVCNLAYEEKTLQAASDSSKDLRSIRYYNTADAALKVGEGHLEPTLRPARKLIGVEIDDRTATLFSPRGPLTRKELELIDVPGNSLLLDRFLPPDPVAVGDSWSHSGELMALLLGLEAVARADVRSTLDKVTGSAAEIIMAGRVEGALYGVSTEIEIKAKYRFDLKAKRIDWFGLLIKEKRNSGLVMDGVDAVGKLIMQITPQPGPTHLTSEALQELPAKSSAGLRRLVYTPAGGGWQLTYDRSWHVYSERGRSTNFRLVDRGEMLTQCNVTSLPKAESGSQLSLDGFQANVQKILGEHFGQFVQAGQWGNEANHRVFRAAVQGTVSEVPIQWNYYLVADEQGRQAVFAFTVEGDLVERLGKTDRELVDSFRFLDPKLASNGDR